MNIFSQSIQRPNTETTPASPTPTRVGSEDIAKNIAQAKDPLLKHLTPESISFLCLTNKTLYKAYQPDAATSRLASHVLWNRLEEVKKLLEAAKNDRKKLEYLLTKTVAVPVKLPSGHLFQGYTPFQAALCTWNVELCELFKEYFEQIPGGQKKMQAQINKIFPEGIEAHIEKQKKAALEFKDKTLRPLIAVITANTTSEADVTAMLINKRADSALGKAIAAFREEIKKLSGEDLVHNPFYLQEAYELYQVCFHGTFRTSEQRDLFCIQGVGCIQCYSPACNLQSFAQGLDYLVEVRERFLGSFKFRNDLEVVEGVEGVSHLEIKAKDFSGLGFDYWAMGSGVAVAEGGGSWGCPALIFYIFIMKKQQALQKLCVGCSSRQPVP